MKVIFCNDPLKPRQPDEAYLAEVNAVKALGLDYALVSYEALVSEHDSAKAVRRVPDEAQPQLGLYRGWMLRPAQYAELYPALADKGIRLINSPSAYTHCHYLPESYSTINASTPKSVWLKLTDDLPIDEIMALLQPFGTGPVILKDFVKSQKHYWHEACFIPSAADREAVERVVRRFLELQGEFLNEGLVFREFVEFEPLTTHAKSGMPLTKEFRMFALDGKAMSVAQYWEEGNYAGVTPPVEQFSQVMRQVQSRFFTMDIAKRRGGDWMIVELGDAQVAGLPETIDPVQFYTTMLKQLHEL
jgi:hypothetical protein